VTNKTSQTVRRELVGNELRRLRNAAKLTLRDVSIRMHASDSWLCRVESGSRAIQFEDVASLLTLYRADQATKARLLDIARHSAEDRWLQSATEDHISYQHTLITLEAKAERISVFEPLSIPDLLQTSAYATARMTSIHDTGHRLTILRQRQSILDQRTPPNLLAIIHESALHRAPGNTDVMPQQWEHLQNLQDRPNINILIIPNETIPPISGFEVINFPHRTPVVTIEHLTTTLFLENPTDCTPYLDTVDRLTQDANAI
jgi:transcriptional regulator with XRE-family HTH domain